MERINVSIPDSYRVKLTKLSKSTGISKSELIRKWIDKEYERTCPNCRDGNYKNCKFYMKDCPIESRCMTDSSVGYCILDGVIEVIKK
jgi:hypothetical protein